MLCRTWGLDRVQFVGAQHGRSLLAWYKWADLFVLPSDREGMPLALLEAMASGLAILTTDVSELADLVGDCGLVVPPSEHQLSCAITRLSRDRILLAALQERSRARSHLLGWDKAVAQINTLYESLSA
jgi:phosphatidylinositol alpha-mannosyltransferase